MSDEIIIEKRAATKEETMKHFEKMYTTYGRKNLMIWVTDDGNWIDETILFELASEGKINRIAPVQRNMWLQGYWEYKPAN